MNSISISITGELSYKSGTKIFLISIPEIIYCEYKDDQCTIVLLNEEQHIICCQLNQIMQELPSYFFTINRNVIINLRLVKCIKKSQIVLKPGIMFEISIRKHRELLKIMFKNKRSNTEVLIMNDYPQIVIPRLNEFAKS